MAVPISSDAWTCLVVVELRRSGAGARTTLIAGTVDWYGTNEQAAADISELPIVEQGLTRIELFTQDGVRVVGNIGPVSTPFDSNYRDYHIGAVHQVWGWKSALQRARRRAALKRESG